MEYDDEQIQLAHYIFLVNLPPDEVLVKTSNNSCTRKSLWSLSPRSFVDAEVITAVACHLTLEELWTNSTDGKGVCYLPAELQELVISCGITPKRALDLYKSKFISRTIMVSKVCVPMRDNVHWYLTDIKLDKEEVHILDSQPTEDRNSFRLQSVQTMMRFIQASWKILYREQGPGLSPPRIAEFSYTNPSKDQEQLHRSDSGV
ncbi:unnamed protein product [Linum tenue]|uniref:Ubiquitin-like protease family profile domain-containing protein n=1 Tax=Linum tenue TaxID=586396 RepID=A0AAV0K3S4_9ROSI|nr:unnamed protein product [Linum tenue]